MFMTIKGIRHEMVIEDNILVYKNYYCKCSCNKRIKKRKSHIKTGIPKFILGHNTGTKPFSPQHIENIRKSRIGTHRTEITRLKQSASRKKYYKEHPEAIEFKSKSMKIYCREHPDFVPDMSNIRKCNKSVSKPELKIRKELDKLNIKYFTNIHEIIGTPDIIIKDKNIALFVDGCYWHGCERCFQFNKINNKTHEKHTQTRSVDKSVNEKLTEQGYKVIRIWEHDIKNGKYKEILNSLKEECE